MILKHVCVVLTTRGNYAKMKTTLRAVDADPRLVLQVVVGGALLDPGYGDYRAIIEADGIAVDASLVYIVGEATPEDVAESAGQFRAVGRGPGGITKIVGQRGAHQRRGGQDAVRAEIFLDRPRHERWRQQGPLRDQPSSGNFGLFSWF